MRVLVAVLFSLMAALAPAKAAPPANTYTVYIAPKAQPAAIHKVWRPILERLSAETGLGFELRFVRDYPAFESALANGHPDLAFMNPYQMLLARRTEKYEPLVRDRADTKRGTLVVRKDGPVREIADLKDARIAFATPNAFVGSLYLQAALDAEGVSIRPYFVNTHGNVLRHVLLGNAAAGGTNDVALGKEPREVQAQLRAIYTAPELPSYPFAAHPRIPADVREKIAEAFIHLGSDSAFTRLLEEAEIAKPVRANYASDYRPLEKLRLERFADTKGLR